MPFLLIVATLSSATWGGANGWSYYADRRTAQDVAVELVQRTTRTTAHSLDMLLRQTQCEARAIAALLSGESMPDCVSQGDIRAAAQLPPAEGSALSESVACVDESLRVEDRAEQCLRSVVRHYRHVYGASISYGRGGHPDARPDDLHSVYVYQPPGSTSLVSGPIEYDYVDSDEYTWYDAEPGDTTRWSDPYYDEAGRVHMVTYSVAFSAVGSGTKRGVVTMDISSDQIRREIQDLDLDASGYGALTSSTGRYLYHPNRRYLGRTISDIANLNSDENRDLIWTDIRTGEGRGILSHLSQTTGERSWLVWEPVQSAGWNLQNTFIVNDIRIVDDTASRRAAIKAVVAAVIFLASLLSLSVGVPHSVNQRRLWYLSSGVALSLLAGIWTIWSVALVHPPDDHASEAASRPSTGTMGTAAPGRCAQIPDGVLEPGAAPLRLTQPGTLRSTQETYAAWARDCQSRSPIFVQFGIAVETLRFLGENQVGVGGQAWVRIPADAPAQTSAGVSLANTVGFSVQPLDSAVAPDGTRTHRFSVDATVAQSQSSARYPIEQEVVQLEVRHNRPIVNDSFRVHLVPNLSSYDLTNPTARPGLDPALSVPGWQPVQSYFHLRAAEGRTNLGIEDASGDIKPPELLFEIVLTRNFVDAFISNLTPIIVVAIMLFAVLMVSAKLDYGRALSICVGMFFVIAFSHIDLRQRLAAQEIFYLEYFYFAIYAGILWVSFNCLLQAFEEKFEWIEHKQRLWPKTTYWPFLLGAIFAVTVRTFY